jgi:hypothetical protein
MTDKGNMIVYALFRELPLEKCLIFSISYSNYTFDGFIQDFGFVSIKQLKALSADDLWKMYYNGQASIYCVIAMKEDFVLNFKRRGNKMIVCDQANKEHELSELLHTPEEIAAYTRQQAFLQESCPTQTIISPAFNKLYNHPDRLS